MKFKIRGTAIEDLPEMEIEANTKEEAQDKYCNLYASGDLEGEEFDIDFGDEEEQDN